MDKSPVDACRDAVHTLQALQCRELSALDVTNRCLARIAESERLLHAWARLDPERGRQQAREADVALANHSGPSGRLLGIPVGIKDIFDTVDFPTENGSSLDYGRRPAEDALVVSMLREAGAVILGKTVTTELATFAPGPTANPRDPGRTPGGSSSGSAAAVAAGMVPLALGTQTNGSVIRPAAYCGIVGFKPTRGTIARNGVLMQSETLDQVGVFANSVVDAALIAQTIMSDDPSCGDARPANHPDLVGALAARPQEHPRLGFAPSPVWKEAEPTTQQLFVQAAERLAGGVPEIMLPVICTRAVAHHRTIGEFELARAYESYYVRGKDRLSPQLRGMIENGRRVSADAYVAAVADMAAIGRSLAEVFDKVEAIVTPATTGEAPVGLESTGTPIFCTLWTLCGLPCITLPLLTGPSGMPLGVQLVGPFGDDARLLQIAQWLMDEADGQRPRRARRASDLTDAKVSSSRRPGVTR